MRLTWKLTMALLALATVSLVVNLVLRVQREEAVFRTDMKQDHALLASFLAADLIEEWRENGPAAARDVLSRRAPPRGGVTARVVEVAALDDDVRDSLEARVLFHEIVSTDDGDVLRTLAPVLDRGALVLALELDESLSNVDGYLDTTLRRAIATFLFSLFIAALVVGGFGFVIVGRPVQALVAKARRTGAGDLSEPLVVRGNDELSLLAQALNDMCDQLKVAHQERDAATEARVATLERLRHVDRLSTVGTLAAGIAHELGTPLHVVAGRAQLILDTPGSVHSKHATVITEQASRMTRIVRQLLDFARQSRPDRTAVDVAVLVPRVVDLMRLIARKRDVVLAVEVVDPEQWVDADAVQIEQALTNLVVNAIQASSAGQVVRIAVRHRAQVMPPADLGSTPRDEVEIVVDDDAGGIPPESVTRLFTPFFTTKDVGEGTGLGLAIAWGLVREHDGTIDVATVAGRGSTFTIRLATTVRPTRPSTTTPTSPLSILPRVDTPTPATAADPGDGALAAAPAAALEQ
ncbi:MAG TPA: ATP-binding protein [Myxococcota bacterium]